MNNLKLAFRHEHESEGSTKALMQKMSRIASPVRRSK